MIQEATAQTRMDIEVNHEMVEVHNHTAFCIILLYDGEWQHLKH
jgi:hypothetical protein